MTTEKKPRKTPVPADPQRILEGAMRMPLELKVALRNQLSKAIEEDMAKKEKDYQDAKKLVNGTV